MSWQTFSPCLPHTPRIIAMLKKAKQDKREILIAVTNYGYGEIANGKVTHFMFGLPCIHNWRNDENINQSHIQPSFSFTKKGTDCWLPNNAQVTNLFRTIFTFPNGWEYRREDTNGRVHEYWWVPNEKLKAFELFIKDNATN